MSLLTFVALEDKIYMACDSRRCTTLPDKTNKRLDDDAIKVEQAKDFTVFGAGMCRLHDEVYTTYRNTNKIGIRAFQRICKEKAKELKKYYSDDDLVCTFFVARFKKRIPIAYVLTSWDNYKITRKELSPQDTNVYTYGWHAEDLCRIFNRMDMSGIINDPDVLYEQLKITYGIVACEEVGGKVHLFELNNKNILKELDFND